MRPHFTILLFVVALVPVYKCQELNSPWAWECRNKKVEGNEDPTSDYRCVRVMKTDNNTEQTGLNTCKLTCGPNGILWPKPTHVNLDKNVEFFIPENIGYDCPAEACTQLIESAIQIFLDNLDQYHPNFNNGGSLSWDASEEALTHEIIINFYIEGNDEYLNYKTDEGYDLNVTTIDNSTNVSIYAQTFFGARHGLETLSQLIDYDYDHSSLQIISGAEINDSPIFKHRGISLDTSRNYIRINSIKRTIDGMAANKLNILHWHITDSHSFPLELPNLPNMTLYGAYSPSQVYTANDVKELVTYAKERGVHILPEFDAPAHVGNGFQWGEEAGLGKLAVCVEQEPWASVCVEPPCGQLNIANEEMYDVLSDIYKDIADMFRPMHAFHYGGDEVNLNCWNQTDEIINWMEKNEYGRDADAYYNQWSVFQTHARDLLINASDDDPDASAIGEYGIIWTSHLTEEGKVEKYLNKDEYIIQIWTDKKSNVIKEVLDAGFRVIFSNYDAWYLDCGFGAWVGDGPPNVNWCSPYKGWQTVYDNSPHQIAQDLTGNSHIDEIFGGEVAMWTEQTDDMVLDSRLWPRSAAFGERMWSNPDESWRLAETRMIAQRQRLVQRGIHADRLQPEWCHQNEGLCYAYPAPNIPPVNGTPPLASLFTLNFIAVIVIVLLSIQNYTILYQYRN